MNTDQMAYKTFSIEQDSKRGNSMVGTILMVGFYSLFFFAFGLYLLLSYLNPSLDIFDIRTVFIEEVRLIMPIFFLANSVFGVVLVVQMCRYRKGTKGKLAFYPYYVQCLQPNRETRLNWSAIREVDLGKLPVFLNGTVPAVYFSTERLEENEKKNLLRYRKSHPDTLIFLTAQGIDIKELAEQAPEEWGNRLLALGQKIKMNPSQRGYRAGW